MDPRIARTQQSLQDALLELCRTEGFPTLSVSMIADAAGVNRSTFYQHYADKETLLADALDRFAEQAQSQLEADIESMGESDPRTLIHRYFTHVQENSSLYQTVLSSAGSPVIVARLSDRIIQLATYGLSQPGAISAGSVPVNVRAASLAGSFIGILREWINMKPLPSAEDATAWAWAAMNAPVGSVD
jgi:AcrR family transcriptional regulator